MDDMEEIEEKAKREFEFPVTLELMDPVSMPPKNKGGKDHSFQRIEFEMIKYKAIAALGLSYGNMAKLSPTHFLQLACSSATDPDTGARLIKLQLQELTYRDSREMQEVILYQVGKFAPTGEEN